MGDTIDKVISIYVDKILEEEGLDNDPAKETGYRKYIDEKLHKDITNEVLEIYKEQVRDELLQELTRKELLKYKIEEWHYFILGTIVIALALGMIVNQFTNAIDVINIALNTSESVPLWILPGTIVLICVIVVAIAVVVLFKEKKYMLDNKEKR